MAGTTTIFSVALALVCLLVPLPTQALQQGPDPLLPGAGDGGATAPNSSAVITKTIVADYTVQPPATAGDNTFKFAFPSTENGWPEGMTLANISLQANCSGAAGADCAFATCLQTIMTDEGYFTATILPVTEGGAWTSDMNLMVTYSFAQ